MGKDKDNYMGSDEKIKDAGLSLRQDKEEVRTKSLFMLSAQSFSGIANVILGMVVPRVLNTIEYGAYKQFLMVFNLVFPFFAMGLMQGLYYFLPVKLSRYKYIVNTYFIYAVISIVYAFFMILGGAQLVSSKLNSEFLSTILLWQIPYLFFSLIDQCSIVVFNVENTMKVYSIYKIAGAILSSLTVIAVVLIKKELFPTIIAMVICKAFYAFVGAVLTKIKLSNQDAIISFDVMGELLKFSIPIGVSGMIGVLCVQLDQLFISVMYDTETYALYSVGATDIPYYSVIIASLTTALLPVLRKYLASREYDSAIELERTISIRVASITIPLMCYFAIWGKEYICFMYSAKYAGATAIFFIYLLQYPLNVFLETPIFVSMGLGRQLLWKSIFACLLNILFNFIFIVVLGYIGAAIGTVLSGYLMCFLYTIPLLSKSMGMKKINIYPGGKIATYIALGVVAGTISGFIRIIVPCNVELTRDCALVLIMSLFIYLTIYFIFSKTVLRSDYMWLYRMINDSIKKVKHKLTV